MKTIEQYTVGLNKLWIFAFIVESVFQFEVSMLQCSFNTLTKLLFARNKLQFK